MTSLRRSRRHSRKTKRSSHKRSLKHGGMFRVSRPWRSFKKGVGKRLSNKEHPWNKYYALHHKTKEEKKSAIKPMSTQAGGRRRSKRHSRRSWL